jgi:hypothetical protein
MNMKNFKYVYLAVGLIYLIEVAYAFVKPSQSYAIFSFEVSFFTFVVFKVILGIVFIMLFRRDAQRGN